MKITRTQLRQLIRETIDPDREAARAAGGLGIGGMGVISGATGASLAAAGSTGPAGVTLAVGALAFYAGVLGYETAQMVIDTGDKGTKQAINDIIIRMISPALKRARAGGLITQETAIEIHKQITSVNGEGEVDYNAAYSLIPMFRRSELMQAETDVLSVQGAYVDKDEVKKFVKLFWADTLKAKRNIESEVKAGRLQALGI
jgi:hypothetical protein